MKIVAKKGLDNKWSFNEKALKDEVDKVEEKSRERLLSTNEAITDINKVDDYLTKNGVCRKNRYGILITINHFATTFPNSYNGVPLSTQLIISYNKAGVPIISKIVRSTCGNKAVKMFFPDAAKKILSTM